MDTKATVPSSMDGKPQVQRRQAVQDQPWTQRDNRPTSLTINVGGKSGITGKPALPASPDNDFQQRTEDPVRRSVEAAAMRNIPDGQAVKTGGPKQSEDKALEEQDRGDDDVWRQRSQRGGIFACGSTLTRMVQSEENGFGPD